MKTNPISGKRYVVIGGSSGISKEFVNQAVQSEAYVYAMCRNRPNWIDSLDHVQHISIDVTDSEPFKDISIDEPIDGLIYCPGSINLKPFTRLTDDDFAADWNINLMGLVKTLQAFHSNLRKSKKASVVLFSTVAVQTGMSYHASIAAAKGALEGLTRSLAAEWASQSIRVNAIALSLTDTPLAERLLASEERRDASASRHPLKRIGSPKEAASTAMFLLSDASSWMTGQIINLDGGISSIKHL